MTAYRTHRTIVAALAAWSLLTGGCAWLRGGDTIDESYRGSVFLERVPERGATAMYRPAIKSIHATHPVSLEPAVFARLLRGVYVRAQAGSPAASQPSKVRVFSDDDVEFLAPLLSVALARATSDQRVGFNVVSPARQGTGTTEGTLYADRPLLHLTLTRVMPAVAASAGGDVRRALAFEPEAAQRRDTHTEPGLFSETERAMVAVDYEMLMKTAEAGPAAEPMQAPSGIKPVGTPEPMKPTSASSAGPAAPPGEGAKILDEIRALKEHAVKKDMENEALKDDLKALRQKLADQEAELNKLKKRKGKKAQPDKQP